MNRSNGTNRVAVISGAARGIGRAFAERLADDGFTLVLVDRDPLDDALAKLSGSGHAARQVDITSEAGVDGLRDFVSSQFGRCDVLVNNAGIYPPTTLDELTYQHFRHVQAVNVDGTFLMTLALTPLMRANRWGRVVNTGSTITLSQTRDLLAYIVSKAAVHGLTRSFANELGEFGITVNAIAPSIIPTEGVNARPHGVQGLTNAEEVDLVSSAQTIKRVSVPQDLVGTLSFLVSDDAAFLTGQILHVDGGLTRTGA